MSKNNDIETSLLSGKSIDELIKQKIDDEISKELEAAKSAAKFRTITDFKLLPESQTFSKSASYLVFNRKTHSESVINGVQAEGIIGLQSKIREKLIKKEIDSFLTDDYYVKFKSCFIV